MIVEQIWTGNAYRNFNYLIACPETGDALAIDPLDHRKCLGIAKDKDWTITQVLNTHEHGDRRGDLGRVRQVGGQHHVHQRRQQETATEAEPAPAERRRPLRRRPFPRRQFVDLVVATRVALLAFQILPSIVVRRHRSLPSSNVAGWS